MTTLQLKSNSGLRTLTQSQKEKQVLLELSKQIPSDVVPYISVGRAKRQEFIDVTDEFFVDQDSHMWFKGRAGIGKTRIVKAKAEQHKSLHIELAGKQTIWGMMKRIAVSLKMADWPSMNDQHPDPSKLPFVAIHIDDCPNVFDEEFINMLKIAMDTNERDYLEYAISLSAQYNQSEPHEKVAIDHFKEENRPGFRIPFFGKVKFLFTMNHALNDQKDADEYVETHGAKASKRVVKDMSDRAALYSRCLYFDFNTDEETTWGWIAAMMIDNDLAKGASPKDIAEILSFMWSNRKNMRETSARAVVNKLWMYMKKGRAGKVYKNRWLRLVK